METCDGECLGLIIDEERSELRCAVRHAETREILETRTRSAPYSKVGMKLSEDLDRFVPHGVFIALLWENKRTFRSLVLREFGNAVLRDRLVSTSRCLRSEISFCCA